MNVEAIIFDWAGTTVDFGCMAPVRALRNFFGERGIVLSDKTIRQDMGLKKIDHLRALFQSPDVREGWLTTIGTLPTENDVIAGYAELEQRIFDELPTSSIPIPGVVEAVATVRALGCKIGSTTGYTSEMMDILVPLAASQGYAPDTLFCSDQVSAGRPAPYMCFQNAAHLGIQRLASCIKVGDTVSDIREGLNAGMWSVGVIWGSSELGLSEAEANALDFFEHHRRVNRIADIFFRAGAHAVLYRINELPTLCREIDRRLRLGRMPERIGHTGHNAEGDTNLALSRNIWASTRLAESRNVLEQDRQLFLHQDLSSPCLEVLQSSAGAKLTTIAGQEIIDLHGNNVHQIGFAHPVVIAAVQKQLGELTFCPRRFTNQKTVEFATALLAIAPDPLGKVLFAPAASLSISMALKIMRAITGRHKVISLWGAFHGAGLDTISVGGDSSFRQGMGPFLPGVEHVHGVNNYRCQHGSCRTCALECLDTIENILRREGDIGGVLMETIRCTEVQIPPSSYFQQLKAMCERYGALLILDETTISFGRTGAWFAFEHYGIVPDMCVIGKGLGGAIFPLSAVLIHRDFDLTFATSIGHFTHEKNPVAAAAGLAMLDVMKRENLIDRARQRETVLKRWLQQLKERYVIVGDTRLIGMLAAIELVADRATQQPLASETQAIMYACLERGVNFKISSGNIITLTPSLVINDGDLEVAFAIIESAIATVNQTYQKNEVLHA